MKNEPILYYGTDQESERKRIFDGLTNKIKVIDPNLVYAFSPIRDDEKKVFIISADGIKKSFAQVLALIDLAPQHPNWEFQAFRQSNPGDDLSIVIGNTSIGYKDIFFRYLEDGDELHLELNIRRFDHSGFQQNAVFLLLDSLIGEYFAATEIDYIEWKALNEAELELLFPFIELRDLVEARKEK